MDIVERLRIHETNYVRAGERAIFADARSEIERLRTEIESLQLTLIELNANKRLLLAE